MPIYIESRNLDHIVGAVAEHQYLVYIPDGDELNYDAWQYIGAFPADEDNPDGSVLTRFGGSGDVLFADAPADRWTMADFIVENIQTVAMDLDKPRADVTVSEMVTAGYAGTAEFFRHRELVSDADGTLWNFLVATANDISGEYTYKAEDITGTSGIYGPAVNSNAFISSILRHAQEEKGGIGAFNTDANVIGNRTWLGTTGNDVLDGRIEFANGDEAWDIFGGDDTFVIIDPGLVLDNPYSYTGITITGDALYICEAA